MNSRNRTSNYASIDRQLGDLDLSLLETKNRARALSQHSVIFTPGGMGQLGERVTTALGASSAPLILSKFPNSETRIEVHESVRDRHAFVIASMGPPINDAFVDTVLLVQALKLADAARITVVLPYFPYSRQDRKADIRPPISAKAITDIFKVVGAHQIVTLDIHATQIEGFFDGPFENLSGLNQLVPVVLEEEAGELVVVSPDAGGAKRAENFARRIEGQSGRFTPLVVMSKFRPGPDIPPVVTLNVGKDMLAGKTCVLVDDMIDTGGSIIAAAEALKEAGAARVIVCATHAVFSNNAVEKMATKTTAGGSRTIDRVFVTDTLPTTDDYCGFVRVVTVAPLLAEAILRLDQSMGTLRELKERTDLGQLVLPPTIQ